jgi:hypothetical protein
MMRAIIKDWRTLIALTLVIWVAVIVASGLGWNPLGQHWDFSNTGTFGDSFGALSAAMASVAALSAISALQEQRTEIQRLKDHQKKEASESAKRAFEQTFFNLVDLFQRVVSGIDIVRSGKSPQEGQDAFAFFVNRVRFQKSSGYSDERSYHAIYRSYRNDLGHYFRLLYNILIFIDRSEVTDKPFYTRLIRATLSESELIMLALNCAHGEGKAKFLPLVEKYALLNNISEEAIKLYDLTEYFNHNAFNTETAL